MFKQASIIYDYYLTNFVIEMKKKKKKKCGKPEKNTHGRKSKHSGINSTYNCMEN